MTIFHKESLAALMFMFCVVEPLDAMVPKMSQSGVLCQRPWTNNRPEPNNPKTKKGKKYQVGHYGTTGYSDVSVVIDIEKAKDRNNDEQKEIVENTARQKKKVFFVPDGVGVEILEIKRIGRKGIWVRAKMPHGEELWMEDSRLDAYGSAPFVKDVDVQRFSAESDSQSAQDQGGEGSISRDTYAFRDTEVLAKLFSVVGIKEEGAVWKAYYTTYKIKGEEVMEGLIDKVPVASITEEQWESVHGRLIPKAMKAGAMKKLSNNEGVRILGRDHFAIYGRMVNIKTQDGKTWWVRDSDVVEDVTF